MIEELQLVVLGVTEPGFTAVLTRENKTHLLSVMYMKENLYIITAVKPCENFHDHQDNV